VTLNCQSRVQILGWFRLDSQTNAYLPITKSDRILVWNFEQPGFGYRTILDIYSLNSLDLTLYRCIESAGEFAEVRLSQSGKNKNFP
jgi:hypothetical protein